MKIVPRVLCRLCMHAQRDNLKKRHRVAICDGGYLTINLCESVPQYSARVKAGAAQPNIWICNRHATQLFASPRVCQYPKTSPLCLFGTGKPNDKRKVFFFLVSEDFGRQYLVPVCFGSLFETNGTVEFRELKFTGIPTCLTCCKVQQTLGTRFRFLCSTSLDGLKHSQIAEFSYTYAALLL